MEAAQAQQPFDHLLSPAAIGLYHCIPVPHLNCLAGPSLTLPLRRVDRHVRDVAAWNKQLRELMDGGESNPLLHLARPAPDVDVLTCPPADQQSASRSRTPRPHPRAVVDCHTGSRRCLWRCWRCRALVALLLAACQDVADGSERRRDLRWATTQLLPVLQLLVS